MLKVGRDVVIDKKSGKNRRSQYRDVSYDPEGWADADKYLPGDFDLVLTKTKSNKITPAWSVGKNWDGLRIGEKDEILFWKNQDKIEEGKW